MLIQSYSVNAANNYSFSGVFAPNPLFNYFENWTPNSTAFNPDFSSNADIVSTVESFGTEAASDLSLVDFTLNVINPTVLVNIALLIQKIEPPKEKFEIEEISIGSVKAPFIKGFTFSPFKVYFVEDSNHTVHSWIETWMRSMILPNGTLRKVLPMTFSLTRSDANKNPVHIDVYPSVFPGEWNEVELEGGSETYRVIDVTFYRMLTFLGEGQYASVKRAQLQPLKLAASQG